MSIQQSDTWNNNKKQHIRQHPEERKPRKEALQGIHLSVAAADKHSHPETKAFASNWGSFCEQHG